MANPSKNKGDKAERDAVAYFLETVPDLCVTKAMRMLGAGRSEDVGDLHVFTDTAIQVRAYKMDSIGAAVRSSAKDSVTQAGHGDKDYALGMVPYPRARAGSVKWLACVDVDAWPSGRPDEVVEFAMISKALDWVRSDEAPYGFLAYPREQRIAVLAGGETRPVLVAPIEAWIEAYRLTTGRPAPLAAA